MSLERFRERKFRGAEFAHSEHRSCILCGFDHEDCVLAEEELRDMAVIKSVSVVK